MTNHDEHIQNLQRTTADLTAKLATLTTDNTDLKNKLTALETQAKALGEQKTTVITPENPVPVPTQNTVVQAPQGDRGGGIKQLLLMMLMSMMKSQSPQVPTNPYANPLIGSALQPSNPLLGANPSFGNSGLYNFPLSSAAATPQVSQFSAFSGYGASLYGNLNPVRF